MFNDDLIVFYSDFGTDVTRQGDVFRGLLAVADQVAFDAVTHGTHVLRYPAGVVLAESDNIVIGGESYRVAAPPRRIADASEMLAELIAL